LLNNSRGVTCTYGTFGLVETPESIRGMKSLIETELKRYFPLIIMVFNIIGELLRSSVHSYFALPPDKSGGYSQEILTGFLFSKQIECICFKLKIKKTLYQTIKNAL